MRISDKIKFEMNDKDYEANITIVYHVDQNYGADSDGNRGMYMTFMDEVEINGVIDCEGNLVEPSQTMIGIINSLAVEKI